MNKLKFLIVALMLTFVSCSSDNGVPVNNGPSSPTPSGALVLTAHVPANNWGWTSNHVWIQRKNENGNWDRLYFQSPDGDISYGRALVQVGDHVRIIYDIGVDNNECCVQYFIHQGFEQIDTDLKCEANTEPFHTYFDFTIE